VAIIDLIRNSTQRILRSGTASSNNSGAGGRDNSLRNHRSIIINYKHTNQSCVSRVTTITKNVLVYQTAAPRETAQI
jgi:hypothetical protein